MAVATSHYGSMPPEESNRQVALFHLLDGEIRGAAEVSPDGAYRYDLTRSWSASPGSRIQWIMLNPSTADAGHDDATLRRCIDFSRRLGFDELVISNLFALRSTDPRGLLRAPNPVGPDNDAWITRRCEQADMTLVAWGAGPKRARPLLADRAAWVLTVVKDPRCLSITADGMPGHPLRLNSSLEPVPFDATRLAPRSLGTEASTKVHLPRTGVEL